MAKGSVQEVLTVKRRETVGKRRVRRLRHEGVVPGVVYGRSMEAVSIVMDAKALTKVLHSKAGEHALVNLKLEGKAPWEKPALVKSVAHHPVDGRVMHVDFHAIALTDRIKVKVPVALKGDAVGVKQDGGILEQFLREIEIECLPTEIPAGVDFDVSNLKIGDTIHVKDLVPPANSKIITDPAGAIASVQKPKEEKPEEPLATLTEPEVLREKKEEPAAEGAAAKAPSKAPAKAEAEKKEAK